MMVLGRRNQPSNGESLTPTARASQVLPLNADIGRVRQLEPCFPPQCSADVCGVAETRGTLKRQYCSGMYCILPSCNVSYPTTITYWRIITSAYGKLVSSSNDRVPETGSQREYPGAHSAIILSRTAVTLSMGHNVDDIFRFTACWLLSS